MNEVPETEYILGHSDREIRRLMHQAAILRPITERLLRGAGIGRGMRVLDLGCGAGDVSMLAAKLVGAFRVGRRHRSQPGGHRRGQGTGPDGQARAHRIRGGLG
jgi:hypothetical protein